MPKQLAGVLGIVLVALAPFAIAAPCTQGTLEQYTQLPGPCDIGPATFELFEAADAGITGASILHPSDVGITPLPSSVEPGLLVTFNSSAPVTGAQAFDIVESLFRFTVSTGGGVVLTGARLTLNNATATGNGVAAGAENLCLEGAFGAPFDPTDCSGLPDVLLAVVIAGFPPDPIHVSTTFPSGVASLDALADLSVDSGNSLDPNVPGTASLESVELRFITSAVVRVPEPASSALVLLALAVALAPRRFRRPPATLP
jgi:hypothetical protein